MNVRLVTRPLPAARLGRPPAGLLAATGMAISGAAAYGFLVLTARALGPDAYASIATLWGAVFLVVGGLWVPLEQEVTRAVAAGRAVGERPGTTVRRAARLSLVLVLGAGGVVALSAPLWSARILGPDPLLPVFLVVAIGGFAAGGVMKGYLAGCGRLAGWSGFLLVDGMTRLALAALLVWAGVAEIGWYAAAFATSPWIAAGVSFLGVRDGWSDGTAAGGERALARPVGSLVVAAAGAAALANGPALALSALAGAEQRPLVAAFLAGLVLARLPLFAFQAVQAGLLPHLVALIGHGRARDARRLLWRLAGVLVAVAAAVLPVAAVAGPPLVSAAFGPGFAMDGRTAAALAFSTGCWLIATALGQGLVAFGAHGRAAGAWTLGVAIGVSLLVLGPSGPIVRVELAMSGGSAVAALAMALQVATLRSAPKAPPAAKNPGRRPGSFAAELPGRVRHRVRPRLGEPILVPAGIALLAVLAVIRLTTSVSLHLTPDAAHALADADALVGQGVRPPGYLPGFPLVVALSRAITNSDVGAVHVALALALAALGGGLYAVARRFAAPRGAFVGAGAGMTVPVVAEALGWSGGATILATAAGAAALAAHETWIARPSLARAMATGLLLGVAALSHPFVPLVTLVLLGARWLSLLAGRRRITLLGRDPLSVSGLAAAAAPLVVAGAILASRAGQIGAPPGTGLRVPDPAASLAVFAWATRESELLALLVIAALGGALSGPAGARVIGGGVALGLVLVPAVLEADPSYQTRIAYFLPLLVAPGIARLYHAVDQRLRCPSWPSVSGRVAVALLPVALVAASTTLGFTERMAASARFYQRIEAADLPVFERLRESPGGLVATSWPGNAYGDGLPVSWLVEGLADRAAAGPVDPVLTTRPEQAGRSAEIQRLFAGATVLENGGLQVAFGPDRARADPAVLSNFAGFFQPLLYVNSVVNGYPADPPVRWVHAVAPDGATSRGYDRSGRVVIGMHTTLRGDAVRLVLDTGPTSGSGSLWVWPAYGIDWTEISPSGSTIAFTARPVGGGSASTRASTRVEVTVERARVRYHARETRFDVEALEIVPDGASFEVRVRVPGGASAPNRVYDERTILRGQDVRQVLVWRSSGWLERFDNSGCYRRSADSPGLVLYDVVAACRRNRLGP